ncbi:MAG: primosomal protein N' (replication factor Y) (superfamily II helicase) [Parcubacteria group bacterium Gr01-1014_38]|nr:MAG: primosomal protein N' (replication factor Y) (superfamily II helicase) [Parcubacteria group bacterium Gr01-1014_38]
MVRARHTPTWEVVPFVPLPLRSRQAFTYRAPDEGAVRPGMLVRIPFGRRTVSGMVLRRATDRAPVRQLKTISAILSREPLFSQGELAALRELSEFSLEPLSLLMKSAALVRYPIAHDAAVSFSGPEKRRRMRLPRVEVQWQPLAEVLPQTVKHQVLILVPETTMARDVLLFLDRSDVPRAFFAQTLPLRDRRALLRRLTAGDPLAVVATHPGVFLPLPHLSRIIVVEASLPAHRQWDLHPRYDARIAALVQAKARGIPLAFQSTLPALDLARVHPPPPGRKFLNAPVRVIPRLPTDPFVSPPILAAIRNTVERGGSVFLFHDIVGQERAFVCGTCGFFLACAECGGTLERIRSQLGCSVCGAIRGPVLRFCPRCNSPHFTPRRIGTASIVEILRHAVPDTPILRADRQTVPRVRPGKLLSVVEQAEPASRSTSPGSQIVVGTERAFAALGGTTFDQVIVLDADRLLESPVFDAAERMVVTIARLAQFSRRQQPLLFSTTHGRLSVVRALETNLQSWVETELSERQFLGYPPWTALVRLERDFSSAAHATRAARALLQYLRSVPASVRSGFQIVERPRPRAEIILRGPLSALSTALKEIPGGWETDPIVPVSSLVVPSPS